MLPGMAMMATKKIHMAAMTDKGNHFDSGALHRKQRTKKVWKPMTSVARATPTSPSCFITPCVMQNVEASI